ncbi:hypothetical protein JOB18_027574 [Solea senegalensis]|uniref:Uncharacterized protein n=1 Tax=Solea senegalensis TaxID=28829 RepID=A0AAV6QNN5_SOLSE|nr:hypothetical protein JOB18_027574 [Solea senegalensis]
MGVKLHRTTTHHPQANEHLQVFPYWSMKAALHASLNDGNWVDRLQWVMLGFRTATKEDLNSLSWYMASHCGHHGISSPAPRFLGLQPISGPCFLHLFPLPVMACTQSHLPAELQLTDYIASITLPTVYPCDHPMRALSVFWREGTNIWLWTLPENHNKLR